MAQARSKSRHRDSNPICVKFYGTYTPRAWIRQFPGGVPKWGNCHFLLGTDAAEFDWLVVYNDLPRVHPEEVFLLPRERTILVTTEPSSIKAYGRAFTNQFGHVLTSQEPWALPHRNRIYSQPGLQWYYGLGENRLLSYDQMAADVPLSKRGLLSTVCSNKRQRHTLHGQRYRFTEELKKRIPHLEIYGHGVREMDDKAEAIAPYKYHIAVENHRAPHHWTEKLADVFLGAALPFYCGCTNLAEYFPEESFIPIDINDAAGAAAIIETAIREGEYEKRLPYILEARRRVLEEYNIFAVLSREIEQRHRDHATCMDPIRILSRRRLRVLNPHIAVGHLLEKLWARVRTAGTRLTT